MIFKVYLGVIANILIPHIFMSLKKGEQPHIWKALPHLNSDKCALCDVDRSYCRVSLGWIGTCGHHCLMTPMCVIIAELSAATNLTWDSSWSILFSHQQTRIWLGSVVGQYCRGICRHQFDLGQWLVNSVKPSADTNLTWDSSWSTLFSHLQPQIWLGTVVGQHF